MPVPRAAALGAGIVTIVLSYGHPGHAGKTPEQICQAAKTDAAGRYSACLAKAEKAFALTADTVKYAEAVAKCDLSINESFEKAEVKAEGQGTSCLSTGDVSAIKDLLEGCGAGVVSGVSGGSLPPNPLQCAEDLAQCQTQPAAQPLTSGQTLCWNSSGVLIDCAGTGHDGDHQNGFARNFVDNGDGTISDLATGLMWEKLSDDGGIHDKDTSYTWNDAFAVKVATLNSMSFAGYSDWRVPNVRELHSIVNFGAVYPAAYAEFNTNCTPGCTIDTCSCTRSDNYWTSTTYVSIPSGANVVVFDDGEIYTPLKMYGNPVRAVRTIP
ncbi:MAG TPA: DUF1566 domain-containing protein [Candidatus Limnocylindrales bacterium]|nr:DUF1566 domain-containing protein [Candidatus Limnocylindrales bacterium]